MSRLSKLLGKPIELEMDGEKFDIFPLNGEDLDLIMGLNSQNEQVKTSSLRKLLIKTVKRSVPDATDEEILALPFEKITKIIEVAMEANGLKDSMKSDKLETIKQKILMFKDNKVVDVE